MTDSREQADIKAPTVYREWLDCLALFREGSARNTGLYDALTAGSFAGSEVTLAALQRQIIDAVNAALDRTVRRFIGDMNDSIAFHEWYRMECLFRRLKKDVRYSLFFETLSFLPADFRRELADSVRRQMTDFREKTVRFLSEQAVSCSDPDIGDALYLIRRIKLFE